MEYLQELFRFSDFMPHGYCFLWLPDILWVHIISDIIIVLSYFAIPIIILFILLKNKSTLTFRWIYVLFAAFIFLCGLTHLMNIVVLWHPVYRLQGLIKGLTASVSLATAIMVLPIVPQFLSFYTSHNQNEKKDLNS